MTILLMSLPQTLSITRKKKGYTVYIKVRCHSNAKQQNILII